MTHPQNAEYVTTVGHTVAVLTVTLQNDGAPMDLSTATTIELRYVNVHDGVAYSIDLLPSVTNAAGGVITHTFTTFPHAGTYDAQYVIDFASGDRAYIPDVGAAGRDYYRHVFLPPVAPDPAP